MRIQKNDAQFKINAFKIVKRHDYTDYTKNDNEGPEHIILDKPKSLLLPQYLEQHRAKTKKQA